MARQIRALVFGDTVGKPGRVACRGLIGDLRQEHEADLVVLNGENLAHGSSISIETAREIMAAGVDVITTGDHVFKKKEALQAIEKIPNLLRPANYPEGAPGRGSVIVQTKQGVKIGVVNIMGRVFMQPLECPFRTIDRILEEIRKETNVILVDFHAEATSEKVAMGWHLDGRVSAVYGTHTHIQTADECILPKGTAYMTELGMCGPYRSVIGRDIGQALARFRTQMPGAMEVAEEDPRVSGALIEIEAESGRALSIKRIHRKLS